MPSDPSERPRGVPGSIMDPGLPGGRAAGQLFAEHDALRFEGESVSASLPLSDVELRLGGANNRLVFFSHPSRPGISLYTADHGILQDPVLRSHPDVAEQVSSIRTRKTRARLTGVAVLAAVVLSIAGLFALKDPIVGVVADRIPPSLEVRFGSMIFSQIESSTSLIEDPELLSSLRELVEPLLEAVPQDDYPYTLHLADDPTINAFALPGGNIVLHSGLVLQAESAEEVLGVLAHEIAHVSERHTLRQLIGTAGLYIVVESLLGDMSGLAAVIADGGLRLTTLSFSRDFEREADDVGWDFLLEADIDPRGMIELFGRLAEQAGEKTDEGASLEGSLALLSTHPTSQERIERLAHKWEELDDPSFARQPAAAFASLQDAVRRRVGASDEPTPEGTATRGAERS